MNGNISHRARSFIIAAGLAVGVFAASAVGAQAQGTPEQRAACTPDALRLCSSAIPDVGRVTTCMKANRANLSARCQAALPGGESRAPVVAAAPSRLRVAHAAPVVGRTATRPARYSMRYAVRPRRHHYASRGGMFGMSGAQTAQAMMIARQVMTAVGSACGSQSLPSEVCGMSGNLMRGFMP